MQKSLAKILSASALAFAMFQAGSAAADGAAPPPAQAGAQPGGKPHGAEHMIQRFDKNNNHALEASEVPPKMWAHLSIADANKDGSITAQELQEAHASGKLPKPHHGAPDEGGQSAGPPPSPTK